MSHYRRHRWLPRASARLGFGEWAAWPRRVRVQFLRLLGFPALQDSKRKVLGTAFHRVQLDEMIELMWGDENYLRSVSTEYSSTLKYNIYIYKLYINIIYKYNINIQMYQYISIDIHKYLMHPRWPQTLFISNNRDVWCNGSRLACDGVTAMGTQSHWAHTNVVC